MVGYDTTKNAFHLTESSGTGRTRTFLKVAVSAIFTARVSWCPSQIGVVVPSACKI